MGAHLCAFIMSCANSAKRSWASAYYSLSSFNPNLSAGNVYIRAGAEGIGQNAWLELNDPINSVWAWSAARIVAAAGPAVGIVGLW